MSKKGFLDSYSVEESGDYDWVLPEGSCWYRFDRKRLKVYNGLLGSAEARTEGLKRIPPGSKKIVFSARHGMKNSTYTDPAFE